MMVTQRRGTEAYFAVTWLRISEMKATLAGDGNPYFTHLHLRWPGLLALISAVLTQSVTAQSQAVASADLISIDYGAITQHYRTTWSDPSLPAGVSRGMAPAALDNLSRHGEESSSIAAGAKTAISTDAVDDTSEAAVLYTIDLGKDGMFMIVSVKTSLQPGDCTALERSGDYLNLRRVHSGFCDTSNQATISRLQSVNVAAAQRCKVIREQLETMAFDGNQTPTPSEIGMLCDGS